MQFALWILLIAGSLAALVLLPDWGIRAQWRSWQALRRRSRIEDGLKHLLALAQQGQSGSAASLAGALGLSEKPVVKLLASMESRGTIQSTRGGLQLTPEGERLAMQVVRAHRLYETYLADEARIPLAKVHGVAERAEHGLSAEHVDALDAHLGHPLHDPHGDPIPRADGTVAPLKAVPLTDWPIGRQAHVAHVEDEPDVVFRQILALGIERGTPLRVLESNPDCLVVSDGEQEHRLAPVIAASVHVRAALVTPAMPPDAVRLSDLPARAEAEVAAIDPHYRGFGRRRLLDLGLTPGAIVSPELENAFGDPRGYRVRGAMIAIRQDQAKLVWVRPLHATALSGAELAAAPGKTEAQ